MDNAAEVQPSEVEQSSEETPAGFVKAESAQKDINVQHKKYRDEERAKVKATERADGLQKELDELRSKSVDTSIPDVPDPYADNYPELIQTRDEAIKRNATHGAEQDRITAEQQRVEKSKAEHEDQALTEKVKGFDTNMVTLGLNPVEVKKAADTVIEYGMSDMLQDVILEDTDGPLFVSYLAANPIEVEQMNGMSALQLVNHLNSIRPTASLLKPKTSDAPDPPITLSGGGVEELQHPALRGVKYS